MSARAPPAGAREEVWAAHEQRGCGQSAVPDPRGERLTALGIAVELDLTLRWGVADELDAPAVLVTPEHRRRRLGRLESDDCAGHRRALPDGGLPVRSGHSLAEVGVWEAGRVACGVYPGEPGAPAVIGGDRTGPEAAGGKPLGRGHRAGRYEPR